jgi:hypothetical protein
MQSPKRENICEPVRSKLERMGVSTYLVLAAINSALGELKVVDAKHGEKVGKQKLTKKGLVTIGTSEKDTFTGADNINLQFDRWQYAMGEVQAIAPMNDCVISYVFESWLQKFTKVDEEERQDKKEKAGKQ